MTEEFPRIMAERRAVSSPFPLPVSPHEDQTQEQLTTPTNRETVCGPEAQTVASKLL